MTTDLTTPNDAAGTATTSGPHPPRSRRGQTGPMTRMGRAIAGIAAASLAAAGLSASPALAAPGNLDASFSGGAVMTDFATNKLDQGLAMALQKDGKIVVAGTTDSNTTPLPPQASDPHPPVDLDFALARYNANGTLDSSFGSGGKVVTAFSQQSDSALAVVIQKDGKIVVGGSTFTGASNATFGLVRYLSDGSLDPNFGNNGRVQTDFTPDVDGINGLALQSDGQSDGKIVAAGVSNCKVDPAILCQQADVALARYNTDGSLDGSFGSGGKVRTEVAGGEQA
ncbi:MAG TPA: hypothetical protein VII47_00870, partial [Actinomycetota bacterium]